MRTLAISDIHGEDEKFERLLKLADYKAGEDRLILLGDYIDRGPRSQEVMERIIKLKERNPERVSVIGGNHEEMFLDYLETDDEENDSWYYLQGGLETVRSYAPHLKKAKDIKSFITEHYHHHLEFIRQMQEWEEDEKHIYVHAGVNLSLMDWKNSNANAFKRERKMFLLEKNQTGKIIVFGHTRTNTIHKDQRTDIWINQEGDKIGIDGGCSSGGLLHCLEITSSDRRIYSV